MKDQMRHYELWLRINGGWRCVGTTVARDNAEALARAAGLLPVEHLDKPMKLVEVEGGGASTGQR